MNTHVHMKRTKQWQLEQTAARCPRGGHSHRRRSHGCDRGQEAVKGSRALFGVGQAVKDNF